MRSLLLIGVEGYETRLNDALFRPALWRPEPDEYIDETDGPKTLVYFGGDIQNFFHLMDQSDPSLPYNDWSLETTAKRLGEGFPQHHIIVIRPSRIAKGDISCYDNFVKGNRVGAPKHVYHYDALLHLERLLLTISMKIRSMTPEALYKCLLMPGIEQEDELLIPKQRDRNRRPQPLTAEERDSLCWFQDNMNLHKYPLTLVGFSKGCVVLNQLLFEFHYARHLEPRKQDSRFISRIEEMFWLDGGHPLKTNTWITARAPLQTLTKLGIKLHVHVSAYQVADPLRPWIRRDEEEFTSTLMSLNANLFRHFHTSNTTDLYSHFAVLENFMSVEERHNPPPPPLDATCMFVCTAFLPPRLSKPSRYIIGVPNTSAITIAPSTTQTPTPLFRKTHHLTRAADLVPGLFLICNANLYETPDKTGYHVVLSIFQAMGPAEDSDDESCEASPPGGNPALPDAPARPANPTPPAPVNLRTELNTQRSFVTELRSIQPYGLQQVFVMLILRKCHRLPKLEPSRFPRIRYRFDIWENHTSDKIEYSATLSVFQVASAVPPERTYTRIEATYARGIPADIPGDDAPICPAAALCFSMLSHVPSTDPSQNDRDSTVNAFVYEDDYVAALPKIVKMLPSKPMKNSYRIIASVGFRNTSDDSTMDGTSDETSDSTDVQHQTTAGLTNTTATVTTATTQAITTQAITAQAVITQAITTHAVTTQAVTTQATAAFQPHTTHDATQHGRNGPRHSQ